MNTERQSSLWAAPVPDAPNSSLARLASCFVGQSVSWRIDHVLETATPQWRQLVYVRIAQAVRCQSLQPTTRMMGFECTPWCAGTICLAYTSDDVAVVSAVAATIIIRKLLSNS